MRGIFFFAFFILWGFTFHHTFVITEGLTHRAITAARRGSESEWTGAVKSPFSVNTLLSADSLKPHPRKSANPQLPSVGNDQFLPTSMQSLRDTNSLESSTPHGDERVVNSAAIEPSSLSRTFAVDAIDGDPSPYGHVGSRIPYGTTTFWIYVCVSVVTVVFAGFASGMTVGLLSIDPIQLRVLSNHGSIEERKRANRVITLVEKHHLLLVTLLLVNCLAMETLPIFLDRLMPSWLAVLLSVTCVLFFGEVLPQAFCTGPKQLTVASASAPFVKVLMFIFFLIAYPIAKLLDWALGGHEVGPSYTRPHLKTLIRMHQKTCKKDERSRSGSAASRGSGHSGTTLGADEVVVIEGALDLAGKSIGQIMVPIQNVFMLEWKSELSHENIKDILNVGHSRVPVYRGSRHNIRGLLMVKSLINVDHSKGVKVHEVLHKRRPLFEYPTTNVYDMLNEFQKGSSHMAFVTTTPDEYHLCWKTGMDLPSGAEILGIVTLEDVIEELIQEEIYDEFDQNGHGDSMVETAPRTPLPAVRSSSGRLSLAAKVMGTKHRMHSAVCVTSNHSDGNLTRSPMKSLIGVNELSGLLNMETSRKNALGLSDRTLIVRRQDSTRSVKSHQRAGSAVLMEDCVLPSPAIARLTRRRGSAESKSNHPRFTHGEASTALEEEGTTLVAFTTANPSDVYVPLPDSIEGTN